jgi:hypothetical protein
VSRPERGRVKASRFAAGRALGDPARRPAVDRALGVAWVCAAVFIVLALSLYVWLPDAGASAPSVVLLVPVVFALAFGVAYALQRHADARPATGARLAASAEREVQIMPADPLREAPLAAREPGAPGDAEPPARADELTRFDGSRVPPATGTHQRPGDDEREQREGAAQPEPSEGAPG